MSKLDDVRRKFIESTTTRSEAQSLQEGYGKEIFDQIQEIKMQMHQEKMEALQTVEAKYKDKLEELENKYATLLRMSQ